MLSKITTIIAFAIILTSCVPTKNYTIRHNIINLEQFNTNEDGVFITTGDYFQAYTSVSIIESVCESGLSNEVVPTKIVEAKIIQDDLYGSPGTSRYNGNYKDCTISDLISEMVRKAKLLNADGIIKLEITPLITSDKYVGPRITGYIISGLAIRR